MANESPSIFAAMKIQPFRALYPNLEVISSPDTFFGTVKYDFADHFANGFFRDVGEEAFFLSEIQNPSGTHLSLVASVDIEEYLQGHILKHEDTIAATEAHLTELLLQRRAMIKPVLLAYPPNAALADLLRRARQSPELYTIHFENESQRHTYHLIRDPEMIAEIRDTWEREVPQAFIADGHHRCSGNANLYRSLEKNSAAAENYRYLLCAFYAFDQLLIHEYNRVVELPRELSPTIFLSQLARVCQIKYLKKPGRPKGKHEMCLYINREWYRLRWRKRVLEKYAETLVAIDTDLLNREILQDIMGIADVRNDTRIAYVDGLSGTESLEEKTDRNPFSVGFCLYPITFEDFVKVAAAGRSLPPKSTWFEPRVKNGLISFPLPGARLD